MKECRMRSDAIDKTITKLSLHTMQTQKTKKEIYTSESVTYQSALEVLSIAFGNKLVKILA